MVFDTTGEAEVTFLGKEAHKLLGVDPTEFHQKQNEVIFYYGSGKCSIYNVDNIIS